MKILFDRLGRAYASHLRELASKAPGPLKALLCARADGFVGFVGFLPDAALPEVLQGKKLFAKPSADYEDVQRFCRAVTNSSCNHSLDTEGNLVITIIGELFGRPDFWNSVVLGNPAPKKIVIRLGCPGGCSTALEMFRELRQTGAHIRAEVYYAGSAAFILSQAADERVIHWDGLMMCHGAVGTHIGGSASFLEEYHALCLKDAELAGLLIKRTGKSAAEIMAYLARNDYWLDARLALKEGFVDRIADPESEPNFFCEAPGHIPTTNHPMTESAT